MQTWELVYDGVAKGFPNVVWVYRGEMSLALTMFSPHMRDKKIYYSMSRTPPEIREPWADLRNTEYVIPTREFTPSEFEQIVHSNYPLTPLPDGIKDKHEEMEREKLEFMKRIGH